MAKKIIPAKTECLDEVLAFVEEQLEEYECPMKIRIQISVAVEEIFVNIAHYAYEKREGDASIQVEAAGEPLQVTITFSDGGIPYNPLSRAEPDITLSAEERGIGGLGIYLVKKSMDDVVYEYRDGKNVLTIKKVLAIPTAAAK